MSRGMAGAHLRACDSNLAWEANRSGWPLRAEASLARLPRRVSPPRHNDKPLPHFYFAPKTREPQGLQTGRVWLAQSSRARLPIPDTITVCWPLPWMASPPKALLFPSPRVPGALPYPRGLTGGPAKPGPWDRRKGD